MASETTTEYDVIVIGAGAVGENVADRAVQGGLTAALVEAELVGGECSYWACMPSKALLRAGSALRAVRGVPGAAEAVTGALDAAAVLARRDEITHDWDDASQVQWAEGAGIAVVRGHARLTGERTMTVTDAAGTVTTLTARHAVVLSTGSAALLPDVPGLVDARPWTGREATSARTVPARLGILGGGVVGVEMATAFADLGSEVTLLARGGLLTKNEPFAGEAVEAALVGRGVDVRRAGLAAVSREGGVVRLTIDGGTDVENTVIEVDELLVATGRVPRTEDLGMAAVGLTPGDWAITDDTLRVLGPDHEPIDWLYATGDVNRRALLTHQGKYQARAVGDRIAAIANGTPVQDAPWGAHSVIADERALPQVTFTDPEVASVGLTAKEAADAGLTTTVVDYDIAWVAGASVTSKDYAGHARMVVDDDRRVVVGATFVGPGVADLLHSATIAIVGEVPIARLWHAVPSYPTVSEVWLRLLEGYGRASAIA